MSLQTELKQVNDKLDADLLKLQEGFDKFEKETNDKLEAYQNKLQIEYQKKSQETHIKDAEIRQKALADEKAIVQKYDKILANITKEKKAPAKKVAKKATKKK